MRSLRRFPNRVFNLATRRAHDERLSEEIQEHLALQTTENLRAGLSPVEARRQAMLKFGGVEAMKQDYRAEGGLLLIESPGLRRHRRCDTNSGVPRTWRR